MVVVDISDPRNPSEVGCFRTRRWAEPVRVDGSYAYVGDLEWLRVVDISKARAPREIASYKMPSNIFGLWVSDGTTYVATYDAGLMILGFKRDESYQAEHRLEGTVQVSTQSGK